jgi:gentisate 1,2-dioxygenase
MATDVSNFPESLDVIGSRQRYYAEIAKWSLAPLWERLASMVPNEPIPSAVPFMWSYSEVRECLLTAGSLISAEEAERRVLILENPGLPKSSQITDTIYAGLQLILPGETAPAHRHTQSALRLVMEGNGGYTSVDGERTMMHPGDFIITPAWTWHDHGSEADGPVIWLDGLDVPMVSFLKAGFREGYPEKVQAISRPEGDSYARFGMNMTPITASASNTSPIFNYPYERSREALYKLERHSEIDPHFGICLRYINPTNGDWAIPTIATTMRLIPRGFKTRSYRSVEGAVLVLMEGAARVSVGGKVFQMQPRDVVALPGWTEYTIEGKTDAVLFTYSDRPVFEKLALWRDERL